MRINSTTGQRLAMEAKAAMAGRSVGHGMQQGCIGEIFLGQVERESCEANERILAGAARKACSRMERWPGQVAIANATMAALAAGVTAGPVAPVLAKVGLESMFRCGMDSAKDQIWTGYLMATALRDTSSDPDQKVAADQAMESVRGADSLREKVTVLKTFLKSQAGAG